LRARTLLDLEAIVAAIAAQDVDGARQAMRKHLSPGGPEVPAPDRGRSG
jgi:DNA-binding FadR family transcriptional regulator